MGPCDVFVQSSLRCESLSQPKWKTSIYKSNLVDSLRQTKLYKRIASQGHELWLRVGILRVQHFSFILPQGYGNTEGDCPNLLLLLGSYCMIAFLLSINLLLSHCGLHLVLHSRSNQRIWINLDFAFFGFGLYVPVVRSRYSPVSRSRHHLG